MTTNYQPPSGGGLDPGLLRDVAALILLLVGCVGLLVAAFDFHWRAGLALVSIYAIIAGAALGYTRR